MHVASWRESYGGLLPAEMLEALSVRTRARLWRRILSDPGLPPATGVWVAEGTGGVVGFGAFGRQRSARLARDGYDGEISALYILRAAQRSGVGARLMRAMAAALAERGHVAVSLWVLRRNTSARRFYAAMGGAVVGQKVEADGRALLIELAYGWADLAQLAGLVT